MSHAVIYIPGLGDQHARVRRILIGVWRIYGVWPLVHEMNWSNKQAFGPKLQSLLHQVDELVAAGHKVSLVGESAGASAAMNAYALRQNSIHRVACICGKLQNAQTVSTRTMRANPAFAESLAMLPASLAALSPKRLQRMRSVHPWQDGSVPIADTFVTGTESYAIPSIGHAASIVLGDTVFSYAIVPFLKLP